MAGEKVLATSGGFRVGEVDDLTCGAEQTGTLRWLAAKKTLQVCEGSSEKWKAAGGAVLDAAEEEPCTSDTPGALQYAADTNTLSVCDGTDTYLTVIVADSAGRGSFTGSVQVGYDELCDGTREGALRWSQDEGLLQVCTSSAWAAVYEPPPFVGVSGGSIVQFGSYAMHVFTSSGTFNAGTGGRCTIFMIGGGGGTGSTCYHNGGGGAGGAVFADGFKLPAGSYPVTVGGGGSAGSSGSSCCVAGSNGGDTTFHSWTAKGGGRGAAYDNALTASPGGCGGGGGGNASPKGGAASNQPTYSSSQVTVYGNGGGTTSVDDWTGSGGGGIGGPGVNNGGGGSAGGPGRDFSSYFGTSLGENGWFVRKTLFAEHFFNNKSDALPQLRPGCSLLRTAILTGGWWGRVWRPWWRQPRRGWRRKRRRRKR